MASSNIKLFDENKGNMLNDTEFNISTQRLNGLQTGVASSQLQNKAMYQTSLVAYAIAQLMLANGVNANDTDAVSTFVNNLSASIVQKKLDKATKQDVTDGIAGKWISSELLKSNNEDLASIYLKLAGGTMLGNLFLNADPTSALQAVTKRYVDSNFAKIQIVSYVGNGSYGSGNPTSVTFSFAPKFIAAMDVVAYINTSSQQISPGSTRLINTSVITTAYEKAAAPFGSNSSYGKKSSNGRTFTWYNGSSAIDQGNQRDYGYFVVAFG